MRSDWHVCASPVKRSRHQVRVPVCGGVSHASHVLSWRIVEFCERCYLLICTSLTGRRITEGEMRARFQSHTITRRRAGRGRAKLAAESQTKLAGSQEVACAASGSNVGLIMPAKSFASGRCCGAMVMRCCGAEKTCLDGDDFLIPASSPKLPRDMAVSILLLNTKQ